jgi:hypothetical protein
MSTYPVDVKSANHSSVATHAIFAGPARVVGIYMSKEKNVGASAVTIKNDTTVVAHFDVPATDNTNGAGISRHTFSFQVQVLDVQQVLRLQLQVLVLHFVQ